MTTLEICIRCPRMIGVVDGRFTCGESGRPIISHRDSGVCPLGKFAEAGEDRKLLRGLIGIGKAVAGFDRPPRHVIARRRAACRDCPQAVTRFGVLAQCRLCGCALAAKTAVASERCPEGKWEAVSGVV